MSPAGATVDRVCGALDHVDLAQVLNLAELQTRVDRKYLVPHTVFAELIGLFETRLCALEIHGRRVFNYESVYFDTPELLSYHQHLQGRRQRFKVRTRTYLDSDETVLEVKTEGGRDETVKDRYDYRLQDRRDLTPQARQIVSARLHDTSLADRLEVSLVSRYQRATLLDPASGSRMTCDVNLAFDDRARGVTGPGDRVLIESKTAGAAAPVDHALWRMGHRPVALSKYCVGLALLNPHVPANRWNRSLRQGFGWVPDRCCWDHGRAPERCATSLPDRL